MSQIDGILRMDHGITKKNVGQGWYSILEGFDGLKEAKDTRVS